VSLVQINANNVLLETLVKDYTVSVLKTELLKTSVNVEMVSMKSELQNVHLVLLIVLLVLNMTTV
jgi:hypothetical protein